MKALKKYEENSRLEIAEANPQLPENQSYLQDVIRREKVEETRLRALENYPEMFGTVAMLFIDVKVNGHPTKVEYFSKSTHNFPNKGFLRNKKLIFETIIKYNL